MRYQISKRIAFLFFQISRSNLFLFHENCKNCFWGQMLIFSRVIPIFFYLFIFVNSWLIISVKMITPYRWKNGHLTPKTKIASLHTKSDFGVKCSFFYLKGINIFSDRINNQLKNLSIPKKVYVPFEKMGIWPQTYFLTFFPYKNWLPSE